VSHAYEISHLLAGVMLVTSFALLYQERVAAVLNAFAAQSVTLALAVAWAAWSDNRPDLFITALIALTLKGIVIPVALHRTVARLGIHREVEKVVGVGVALMVGLALTGLAQALVLKVATGMASHAREDLALALAIILLGFLMMIVRRNAVTQVVGFMSMENGLILAATGARGMPLVVEVSVAFSVLISLFVFAVFVLIPYAAALILVAVPGYRVGAVANVIVSAATFGAGLWLVVGERSVGDYAIVDEFNIVFIAINTLVGFTTALFSASYIGHEIETGRLSPSFVRFYHAMFQAMMGSMNLSLIANNIGVMWVGLELATLITVVMVGLYRTPQAIEAAWKYFILASVGISLAFFGTILIYLAGQPALGEGVPAMTWSLLQAAAARMDPAILDLAFIFLLIGYGTKVGLAPLHAWLPDAHAEGPTPISAVLSGLLLNVALYALLRFKMLVAGQPAALDPGPVMVVMGLVSLIFAAFMLYQRRDIKRLFAYSSIEHMGLIVFAFGMGGPLANFAGLLHMAMHSLTKSGIFFAVGHIAQAKGTQRIAEIRGLSVTHPRLAVVFALAVLAICGMPPFGVFTSEFLILTTTFAREPWLALLPAFGLLIGFGALLLRLQDTMFGEPVGPAHHVNASSVPMVLHLLLVLAAGIFLPPVLVAWFQRAAELLG
jgi:hydrogenase-4 component F